MRLTLKSIDFKVSLIFASSSLPPLRDGSLASAFNSGRGHPRSIPRLWSGKLQLRPGTPPPQQFVRANAAAGVSLAASAVRKGQCCRGIVPDPPATLKHWQESLIARLHRIFYAVCNIGAVSLQTGAVSGHFPIKIASVCNGMGVTLQTEPLFPGKMQKTAIACKEMAAMLQTAAAECEATFVCNISLPHRGFSGKVALQTNVACNSVQGRCCRRMSPAVHLRVMCRKGPSDRREIEVDHRIV